MKSPSHYEEAAHIEMDVSREVVEREITDRGVVSETTLARAERHLKRAHVFAMLAVAAAVSKGTNAPVGK